MSLTALFGIPVIGEIIKDVVGVVDNVVDKFAGDKMNEKDKEELKAQITMGLAGMDFQKFGKEVDDQIDARALAKAEAAQAPWVTRVINGLVRPTGGLGALVAFFYTIFYKHLGQFLKIKLEPLTLVDWQWIIMLSIIGFFFGLREVSKIKGTSGKI